MTKWRSKINGTCTVFDTKGREYIFSPGQTMDIYGTLIDDSALERVHEEKPTVRRGKTRFVEPDHKNKIEEDE